MAGRPNVVFPRRDSLESNIVESGSVPVLSGSEEV